MEVRYINARIKRGFGTKRVAKQAKDDDMLPKEGEYEWGNANPEYRGVYGDSLRPNISEEGYRKKYWEGQTRDLDKETTANMMYKAAYSQYYSSLQEVPYGLWHVRMICHRSHTSGAAEKMEIAIHTMACYSTRYYHAVMGKMVA